MHPHVEKLIQLQDADRETKRLKDEIAALPKRVAVIEAKLAGSRARVEKARAAIKADEAARRKLEGEIQALQQKIRKYRDQSLEVKTNEQYKALLSEIQFAEQEIRRHEDKILEGMIATEANEATVKQTEAELKAATAEIEKEKADARARTAADEKQLAELEARRAELRAAIPENVLRHYDRVFKLRGSAIAEAREGKCSACQVMLRPQVYNDVRAGDELVFCDSCQRILFYDLANEPAPADARKSIVKHGKPDERAWYYFAGDTGPGVFAAFLNRMRECSLRRYSAEDGTLQGPPLFRDGDFQTAFAHEIEHGIWLFDQIENQDLENWQQLPPEVLDILKRELRIIQVATEQAPTSQ
jgi:predicted  nucleic acid-binding Zn-ribbon protein